MNYLGFTFTEEELNKAFTDNVNFGAYLGEVYIRGHKDNYYILRRVEFKYMSSWFDNLFFNWLGSGFDRVKYFKKCLECTDKLFKYINHLIDNGSNLDTEFEINTVLEQMGERTNFQDWVDVHYNSKK